MASPFTSRSSNGQSAFAELFVTREGSLAAFIWRYEPEPERQMRKGWTRA